MTKNELRSLIKSHFSLIDAPKVEDTVEEVKENFASVTLADGVELSNNMEDDFAVGQMVYVKDEAGEWVAAPEGEHTSDSGITLVVDAEGKLSGVHHPDQAGEGSLEEMSEETVEVELAEEEAIAEHVIETAIEEGMTPSDVIETVKAVIEEVLAPEMEAMKARLAEMELAYKEKMSTEPATLSTQQRKFAAIQEVKANAFKKGTFSVKQAQLEAFLNKKK
jgi:hypothetical protein